MLKVLGTILITILILRVLIFVFTRSSKLSKPAQHIKFFMIFTDLAVIFWILANII